MSTEPTEAERQQAYDLIHDWDLGDPPQGWPSLISSIAQALADQRAEAVAAIQQSWDAQCAGNKAAHCESCRAYDDALATLGERSQL